MAGTGSSTIVESYLTDLFTGTPSSIAGATVDPTVGLTCIGNLAFPPLAGILSSAAFGPCFVASNVNLMKTLWEKHDFKAIGFLDQILQLFVHLSSAHSMIMSHLGRAQESLRTGFEDPKMDQIQKCVSSEKQRRINLRLCKCTEVIIEKELNALKKISDTFDKSLRNNE